MDSDEEREQEELHVYIHVPSDKTGEKYTRYIVPAKCIKKFQYNHYVVNSAQYKDKFVGLFKNAGSK